MQKMHYLDELLKAHESHYDIKREYQLGSHIYEGYAEFHEEMSQYVLVKRAKLWGANTHDYVFFKTCDHLSCIQAQSYIKSVCSEGLENIEIFPDHMASYLTLIFIANTADQDAIDLIRKVHFRKNLKFGLQGWIDLRCALADLSNCRIITNKQGADLKKTLQSCFEKEI